jgi:enediyne biosynthesis protein E4
VVAADLDGSGRLDLFVANDHVPNHLWVNQGEGRFTEEALLAGVSVNREGLPEAGMGVEAGDLTGNGLPDLFLTHLNGETNTLYVNLGGGLFRDQTPRAGLAGPSLPYTGFGVAFFDLDNDGWLDIASVNGQISLGVVQQEPLEGDPFPLGQRNQLFRNLGEGRFTEVREGLGSAFEASEVGRGLAAGDVDNDGTVDLLIANNSGPARLLRNLAAAGSSWVGFVLEPGRGKAAHAPGSQVEVRTRDGRRLRRTARTDGSYLSARDPRVVVGLGPEGVATSALVRWPDGTLQRLESPPTGRYLVVRPASGERSAP